MREGNSSFLEELSQPRPNPGGGAAAAYGASLGLALLEKIVRLELNRCDKGSEKRDFWENALAQVHHLASDFSALRHRDVEAYRGLASALATSQRDPDQLAAALEDAISCPAEIMQKAHEAGFWLSQAGQRCKKHLVADLQVSCELFGAAMEGAYHIARANLIFITDRSARADHGKRLWTLLAKCREALEKVKGELASRA